MPGELEPLFSNNAIVNADGTPTQYFIRWAQQKQIDISGGITLDQAQQLVDDFATSRSIVAGVALDGGGTLDANVTIDHAESLVTPGTYGDATHVPRFVVDQEGHIQGVVPVPIAGGGGGGGGLYDISMGVPDFATVAQFGNTGLFAWSGNGTKGLNVKFLPVSGTGGPKLAGYAVPMPAGTWEVAVLTLQSITQAHYYGVCLGLWNTASGRLVVNVPFDGSYSGMELQTWSDFNNRAGVIDTLNVPPGQPIWNHMKYDGTNVYFGISRDGANPLYLRSTTFGAWVGTPDMIVFGGFFESSDNITGANVSVLCFDPNAATRTIGA